MASKATTPTTTPAAMPAVLLPPDFLFASDVDVAPFEADSVMTTVLPGASLVMRVGPSVVDVALPVVVDELTDVVELMVVDELEPLLVDDELDPPS